MRPCVIDLCMLPYLLEAEWANIHMRPYAAVDLYMHPYLLEAEWASIIYM